MARSGTWLYTGTTTRSHVERWLGDVVPMARQSPGPCGLLQADQAPRQEARAADLGSGLVHRQAVRVYVSRLGQVGALLTSGYAFCLMRRPPPRWKTGSWERS